MEIVDLATVQGNDFDGNALNHNLALFRITVGTGTSSLAVAEANALNLALIAVGYADGFSRALASSGRAFFVHRLSTAFPRAVG
jgi:alanine racemase